jgi:hypothetical protein
LKFVDESVKRCAPTSTEGKSSLANYAVATVIVLSIILIGFLLIRPSMTAEPAARYSPSFRSLSCRSSPRSWAFDPLEDSTTTRFACHTSWRPTERAFIVPAIFRRPQNNRIPKEHACYTCHTDYTMFGDVNAKMRGLQHISPLL